MKMFQKAPLALAVSALMVAPAAFAFDWGSNDQEGIEASSHITSTFTNEIAVDLSHSSATSKEFGVELNVNDDPEHYSGALVDSKQLTVGNKVENTASENNADVGSGTGEGATGNIGVNVAAGDNNSQANDAALASSDAMDVFGQSEIYTAQHAKGNKVDNAGSPNNASLGSGSMKNASGNIGVNVAAGTSNAQQNSLSASSNTASGHTRATVGGVQQTTGNKTVNGALTELNESVALTLDAGDLTGTYEGLGEGGYEGSWRQTNDVYPEIWKDGGEGADGNHKKGGGSSYWGHADFDNDSDSGQDGRFEGDQEGELGFVEAGDIAMSGTMSGNVTTTTIVSLDNANNANIGSGALAGASGNVGVNVAAGSNNMQRNSLAIASSMGGSPATPPNGGGTE